MNISTLASIASLLLPVATYAGTAQPASSPHIPGKTEPGNDEILRRHSTYAGIRMAFDMQNLIDHAAASYLTDREAIRQALLSNLDNELDIENTGNRPKPSSRNTRRRSDGNKRSMTKPSCRKMLNVPASPPSPSASNTKSHPIRKATTAASKKWAA
ncbi:Hypothetical protein PYTT_0110 [Akkermansia glycaniphila]|uniref:Uncharacterized protein n=1 Tax=Akkermansia glycaniphila TaxID=1679444 RepID=A0A1C7PE94_9BACT|nr:hypothetical protein [Akkermansia glycaniphila]OCA03916.1 hypothetical protein AC781_01225 [Akkermansia glycaniphila]SEH70568.1 Hypothetical protein PYTT_0110 [Akkermansia glycaniphila]